MRPVMRTVLLTIERNPAARADCRSHSASPQLMHADLFLLSQFGLVVVSSSLQEVAHYYRALGYDHCERLHASRRHLASFIRQTAKTLYLPAVAVNNR